MAFVAEMRDVTMTYGETTALDDVTFRVSEGEIVGLLGANGSGKTTLLKTIALIEKPTKGEIYFEGVKVTQKMMQQLRLDTTMVFQKTTLFSQNVYDNIAYGLRIRRISRGEIERRIKATLKLVRLEGFEKRQARKLSGGEQQRVALARALVLETKLILLDEPTANLDPKNVSIVEDVVETVNRDFGRTIVMATHNMFQARKLPKRIVLMDNGKIKDTGSPAEVFGQLSRTLAGFSALENILTGEAGVSDGGVTVVDVGGNVHVEMTQAAKGRVSVFISPEDIVLSVARFASSARNVFEGRVVEIQDQGRLVKLKVYAGKPFVVQITKRSFIEMCLILGSNVYLTFKASSVQIV